MALPFHIFKKGDKKWIYLQEFVTFLTRDTVKCLESSDVEPTLRAYKDRISLFLNDSGIAVKAVPVLSILRYIFHHVDTIECCHKLATKICDDILHVKTDLSARSLGDLEITHANNCTSGADDQTVLVKKVSLWDDLPHGNASIKEEFDNDEMCGT